MKGHDNAKPALGIKDRTNYLDSRSVLHHGPCNFHSVDGPYVATIMAKKRKVQHLIKLHIQCQIYEHENYLCLESKKEGDDFSKGFCNFVS